MMNSKYGKILAIASSVCIVLLGIAFIISCAHLYFTADGAAYSRERVGEYLLVLAIPSFITIALTVCGFIYALVSGTKENEHTERTSGELLESFASKFDFQSFDEETKKSVLKIRKRKNIIDFVASEITAICFVVVIDFIVINIINNTSLDAISILTFSMPLSAIAIAVHIPRIYFSEKSAEEELTLLKASIKAHGSPAIVKKTENSKERTSSNIASCVIAGVAIIFIILGIANGGMSDVLNKAVNICAECIGLG